MIFPSNICLNRDLTGDALKANLQKQLNLCQTGKKITVIMTIINDRMTQTQISVVLFSF